MARIGMTVGIALLGLVGLLGLNRASARAQLAPQFDVNGDGVVNAVDALCVLRSIAALPATMSCAMIPLTPPSVGDVNNDGTVNAVDALCILRIVANLAATVNCPNPLP